MIGLELAKKLKEAGLEWEPQRGDWYYFGDDGELHLLRVATPRPVPEVVYSAPRLDQLLAEIEKWGYSWEMRTVIDESQSVRFNAKNIAYWIHVWKTGHIEWEDGFKRAFTSPSNASASALLWILEGGTSK